MTSLFRPCDLSEPCAPTREVERLTGELEQMKRRFARAMLTMWKHHGGDLIPCPRYACRQYPAPLCLSGRDERKCGALRDRVRAGKATVDKIVYVHDCWLKWIELECDRSKEAHDALFGWLERRLVEAGVQLDG